MIMEKQDGSCLPEVLGGGTVGGDQRVDDVFAGQASDQVTFAGSDEALDAVEVSGSEQLERDLLRGDLGTVDELQHCRKNLRVHAGDVELGDLGVGREHVAELIGADGQNAAMNGKGQSTAGL